MTRKQRISPLIPLVAVLLVALAIVPRFVILGNRPLMHDESLFAFYAWDYSFRGVYTHMPILHGPTLMLVVGKLFKWIHDTIGVGRGFVAVTSLIGMAGALALAPRRYRWWLAPLLLTSPVMLYYSRFMRDDMFFNGVLMIGMVGVAQGLTRRPWGHFWRVVGPACILFLWAIMENSLFVYATGVTFLLVWLAVRLGWRSPARWLRPWPRAPRRSYELPPEPAQTAPSNRRRKRGESYLNKSFATVVGDAPRGPEEGAALAGANPASGPLDWTADARGRRGRWRLWLTILGWTAGTLLGAFLVCYVFKITAPPNRAGWFFKEAGPGGVMQSYFTPFWNMAESWTYWSEQHKLHRISGPAHFYLPILVTYELPLLLLLAVGLGWDAAQRRGRALIYVASLVGWLVFYIAWKTFDQAGWPPLLKTIEHFLHVEADGSMFVLGLMIAPLLAWSVLSLKEHRVLAAWMGWWAACSLFQYSSAGEKVPWLVVHIALPFYLAAVWLWAPRLRRMGLRGRWVMIAVVAVTTLLALRNDYYLIGPRAADPRERILYNHTTVDYDKLCNDMLTEWDRNSQPLERNRQPVSLKDRQVALVDDPINGGPSWPGVWYFRHTTYHLLSGKQSGLSSLMPEPTDLLIGTQTVIDPLLNKLDTDRWSTRHLSLRDAWVPYPQYGPEGVWAKIKAWWVYYWLRETWNEPGHFPLIAIEPINTRK